MEMNKEELLDKLRRAFEMEEVMAGTLTALIQAQALAIDIPEAQRRRIHEVLSTIHQDTLRHKQIVSGMMKSVSGGPHGAT